MTRTVPTWTAVPCAALAFAAGIVAGLGVVESVAVAALAIVAWRIGRYVLGGRTEG